MFLLLVVKYVEFPPRQDALLNPSLENENNLRIEASGSIGLHYDGKCQQTYPNTTIKVNEKMDWCSNIAENNAFPYISYSFANKAMKLRGYSVRNGCCWYACCCLDDHTDIYGCCCRLYSFSLLGSNDKQNWKTIHKIHREEKFWRCLYKTYEFEMTEPFKYIKFQMDEPFPNCQRCLQINEIQLYGELINSFGSDEDLLTSGDDESISIIGKIKRNSD